MVQAVNTRITGGLQTVEPILTEEPYPLTPPSKSFDKEFVVQTKYGFAYLNLQTLEQYQISLPDCRL